MTELAEKLQRIRLMMAAGNLQAVHLAQLGNVAWILCGADTMVSATNPSIVEVVVTKTSMTAIVSEVERGRLEREEFPEGVTVVYFPWFTPTRKDELLKELCPAATTLSDTPGRGFDTKDFWALRVPLTLPEIERYRTLGREASEVFTDVLSEVKPGLTEDEVAGRLAHALRSRGMQAPVLLVAADERLRHYRHPIPKGATFEKRLMAVACARRHGLYASVTRLLSVGESEADKRDYTALLGVEAALLQYTQAGVPAHNLFEVAKEAYLEAGSKEGYKAHHQGGASGYNSRDFLINEGNQRPLVDGSAYAWNPSLPGLKVEDTVLLYNDTLETLTFDPRWPHREVAGRQRPEIRVL